MTARRNDREPSLQTLIRQLKDEDSQTRVRAASALGRLSTGAVAATDALAAALKDGNRLVRKAAALALGDIGPAAVSAVPSLVEALLDRDEQVRRRAAVALAEVGEDGLDALRRTAQEGSEVARTVLGQIGQPTRRAA